MVWNWHWSVNYKWIGSSGYEYDNITSILSAAVMILIYSTNGNGCYDKRQRRHITI